MLPTFLFVRPEPIPEQLRFRLIRRSQGVYWKAKFNSDYMTVPDNSLDHLRYLEKKGEVDGVEPLDCRGKIIKMDDSVMVESGPFKGKIGHSKGWNGSHIDLLINGFDMRFRIAPFLLEKLGP